MNRHRATPTHFKNKQEERKTLVKRKVLRATRGRGILCCSFVVVLYLQISHLQMPELHNLQVFLVLELISLILSAFTICTLCFGFQFPHVCVSSIYMCCGIHIAVCFFYRFHPFCHFDFGPLKVMLIYLVSINTRHAVSIFQSSFK